MIIMIGDYLKRVILDETRTNFGVILSMRAQTCPISNNKSHVFPTVTRFFDTISADQNEANAKNLPWIWSDVVSENNLVVKHHLCLSCDVLLLFRERKKNLLEIKVVAPSIRIVWLWLAQGQSAL